MPQYQKELNAYALHFNIAEQCMNTYNRECGEKLCSVEQVTCVVFVNRIGWASERGWAGGYSLKERMLRRAAGYKRKLSLRRMSSVVRKWLIKWTYLPLLSEEETKHASFLLIELTCDVLFSRTWPWEAIPKANASKITCAILFRCSWIRPSPWKTNYEWSCCTFYIRTVRIDGRSDAFQRGRLNEEMRLFFSVLLHCTGFLR